MIRLLGISGSLRRLSTHTALLRAAARAAPEGVDLDLYDGLGQLPIFNPDDETEPVPAAVAHLRASIDQANGLLFAVPEYAHGIPGGFKNMLDWLVSGSEIPHKPVAFFHASTRSHHARAALEEVMRTMSTRIVTEASVAVPLLGLAPEAVTARLAEPEVRTALRGTVETFADYIVRNRPA